MLYEDFEGSRGEFLKLLAEQGEEPAFVRRSRGLEATLEGLRRECQNQRRVMLHGPRLHLRMISGTLDGQWQRVGEFLKNPAQWQVFEKLMEDWNQDSPQPKWSGVGQIHQIGTRSMREFYQSVERFNAMWTRFLQGFDLDPINRVIDGYNQHYVLEKSCAFGSESLAQKGFEPREPITIETLFNDFPTIELPELK